MNNILHLKIRYLVLSIMILLILFLFIALILIKKTTNPPGPLIQPSVIPSPSLTSIPNPNTYTGVDVTQAEEFRKQHPELKTDALLHANLPLEFDGFSLDYSYPNDKYTVSLHYPLYESRIKFNSWLKNIGLDSNRFEIQEGSPSTAPTAHPTISGDRESHPDIYLQNLLPHNTATYLIISKSENGKYQFTVILLKTKGKEEFIKWIESLKFSDDTLATLDIIYK